jgi:RNA polymerase sigma-70 factor (ECF subfamily)
MTPMRHPEGELELRLAQGRAVWPAVTLADEAFARRLGELAGGGALPPLERAADLFIAYACAVDAPGAVSEFLRVYRPLLARAAARSDPARAEDAAQAVSMKLLVRDGDEPPKIVGYTGRVPLDLWLTTVATRTALNQRRGMGDRPHDALSGIALPEDGAEAHVLAARARYAPEFNAALRDALAALPGRPRLLLRLHHVEGWSIDRLALVYQVGRSTTARWLVAAREDLLASTMTRLRERLRLPPDDLESLARILTSALDVSIQRLLGEPAQERA